MKVTVKGSIGSHDPSDHMRRPSTLTAIKICRYVTGYSLREAKERVDAIKGNAESKFYSPFDFEFFGVAYETGYLKTLMYLIQPNTMERAAIESLVVEFDKNELDEDILNALSAVNLKWAIYAKRNNRVNLV